MSEWIKCSERLPDDSVPVIVYSPEWSSKPFVGYRRFGHWQGDRILSAPDGVTHWQPLPDPPRD